MAVEIRKWDKQKDQYITNIYETVAERLRKFREECPVSQGWALKTEVQADSEHVFATAWIVDPEGRTVAVGHAEEGRNTTMINKTSAVENAETSAIGRALMAAGFGGGEFASAEELRAALQAQAEIESVKTTSTEGQNRQDRGEQGSQNQSTGGQSGFPRIEGVSFEETVGRDGRNYVIAKGDTYNNKTKLEKLGFKQKKGQDGKWVVYRPAQDQAA